MGYSDPGVYRTAPVLWHLHGHYPNLDFHGRGTCLSPLVHHQKPGGRDTAHSNWDILNDMFTTQQSKRLYTLTAKSTCLLLEMDSHNFAKLLADFPLVVINLCKDYSQQVRVYQQWVSHPLTILF